MQYVKYLMLAMKLWGYLPMIIELIRTAETDIGPGKGADKLEQVRTKLESADALRGKFEALWPTINEFINLFVAIKLK